MLTFWHFTQNISLYIFQFPQDWPSHIHCLAVFPRQVPIPVDWHELKNVEKSYYPSFNVYYLPLDPPEIQLSGVFTMVFVLITTHMAYTDLHRIF